MTTRRRKSSDVFLTPDGKVTSAPGQYPLSAYILDTFENDVLAVQLGMTMVIRGGAEIPNHLWKLYKVTVHNIMTRDPEGVALEAPIRALDKVATKEFRTEQEARQYYLDTVTKYCKRDDVRVVDGVIKGGGNIYEPPDPNVPTVEEGVDDSLFGSW